MPWLMTFVRAEESQDWYLQNPLEESVVGDRIHDVGDRILGVSEGASSEREKRWRLYRPTSSGEDNPAALTTLEQDGVGLLLEKQGRIVLLVPAISYTMKQQKSVVSFPAKHTATHWLRRFLVLNKQQAASKESYFFGAQSLLQKDPPPPQDSDVQGGPAGPECKDRGNAPHIQVPFDDLVPVRFLSYAVIVAPPGEESGLAG